MSLSNPTQVGVTLDYASATGAVTISATSQPGDVIVSLPARVYDGRTTVDITFYSGRVDTGATDNSEVSIDLSDSTTQVARLGIITNRTAEANYGVIHGTVRLTPTAGSHTYIARGVRGVSNGTIHGSDFGYADISLKAVVVSVA